MTRPTVDDLADELGLDPEPRMAGDLAAACEWVEQRRGRSAPDLLWRSERVRKGALLYAALLYQSRSAPSGFPGFEEFAGYQPPADNAMRRIYQLVGKDPVVA